MMYEASNGKEEVPYCFSGLSFKFQGHKGKEIAKLTLIWMFLDDNSSLDSLAMKASRDIEEVSYPFSRSSIQFQGQSLILQLKYHTIQLTRP